MASSFEQIKDKARKLIHEDALKDSHIIKERQADRAKITMRGGAGAIATPFDHLAPSYGSSSPSMSSSNTLYEDKSTDALYAAMDKQMKTYMENRQSQPTVQTQPQALNTRLPKEILESFSKDYLDTTPAPILDTMGVTNGHQEIRQPKVEQTQVSNGKVDYELIKSIVESTVKKYMGAATKKILSEQKAAIDESSNIAAIRFTGDKFVMVTKNGDLYEAKMEFKKNVNKK